ncbi:hypothetical protein CcaverHIS002_0311310 [Cutaneotrichosporon cavernicola]|uniref:Uncharacterized protein n=1 Tax=Cutaneotrichosporon cavernicola TaxID=279322 RepID=A0AA48L322_9TREE|nr:uncharacterized protein CcaverHIS019_0311170 [Cutaneotrichosporon cavernicola]BEI83263.1 hypothetical protein CcaverHIS002_0311310 [Cutaneotrichosporon cavernicola]BEI91047.1 hypothetical protein CcaverHIS019_0311170 [Cutaneotrichosporon cavernicola]
MKVEHPIASSVSGWMMGLAWDSLWHAFISPQQDRDNFYREIMDKLEIDLDGDIPPENPETRKHARYNHHQFGKSSYPWKYRVDFIKEFRDFSKVRLVAHKNEGVTAVSWDREGGGREFRIKHFKWMETEFLMPVGDPNLKPCFVTREMIHTTLIRLVQEPHTAWQSLQELHNLLVETPTKYHWRKEWKDVANCAVKLATIFRTQYRNALRFAVAAQELADYEGMIEAVETDDNQRKKGSIASKGIKAAGAGAKANARLGLGVKDKGMNATKAQGSSKGIRTSKKKAPEGAEPVSRLITTEDPFPSKILSPCENALPLANPIMDMITPKAVPKANKPPLNFPASCTLVPSDKAIRRAIPSAKFLDLPLEILERIHMYSESEALPIVNKHLKSRFSSVHYKAHWVLYTRGPTKSHLCNTSTKSGVTRLDSILTRRLCNKEVLLRVLEIWEKRLRQFDREDRERQLKLWERQQEQRRWSGHEPEVTPPQPDPPRPSPLATRIPRRLLRTRPGAKPGIDPYVRFLVHKFNIPPDADGCYPLIRGAADRNYELVEWLLRRGTSVTKNDNLALKAAIMNQDLKMLRLLIEPEGYRYNKEKQAHITKHSDPVPLPDRTQCRREWVDLALQYKAYDIVHWLVDEKGLTPSLNRIMNLESAGYKCSELERLQEMAPQPKKQGQEKKNKKRKFKEITVLE